MAELCLEMLASLCICYVIYCRMLSRGYGPWLAGNVYETVETSKIPCFKTLTMYKKCESLVGAVLRELSWVACLGFSSVPVANRMWHRSESKHWCLQFSGSPHTSIDSIMDLYQLCFLLSWFSSNPPVWTSCHNKRPILLDDKGHF